MTERAPLNGASRPRSASKASLYHQTDDLRVVSLKPLLPPAILVDEELPITLKGEETVMKTRKDIARALNGEDHRLVIVVGPCSIHDVTAAKEYAVKLKALADELSEELIVVMRVYFEKPRTTVGWKGLINDPDLNGSYNINKGLRIGRGLLVDINHLGLPAACEFLDTISPQFISDLVAWGAIGARTTESQVHRELASGLSCPVGFKNGTDGSIQIAVDAIRAAAHPHSFLGVTKQGLAAIVSTRGNDTCHVILRGAASGPNYSKEHVQKTYDALQKANLPLRVMIDCSHGNSAKDHNNQSKVVTDVSNQIREGDRGIIGLMIESHLVAGRQDLKDPANLLYGQSITDACVDFDVTAKMLRELAAAKKFQRQQLEPST